ncbi:MAG: hypothetical protein WC561_00585 [Candidatus Omnitrophota bacterium]
MIHLSRFLIGIRHTRVFRVRSLSGQIADDLIKVYPKDFVKIEEVPTVNEIALSDTDNSLITKVSIDDIIVENRKLFDGEKRSYVEVNKLKVINMMKGCLPVVSKRFELDKDYSRIGMIFEFRIPEFNGIVNENFGKFIYNNFIDFHGQEEGSEASLRFVYKLQIPGGLVIKDLKDYRNVIVILNQSKGINEDGKENKCLFVSIDVQRIFEPMQKVVDVDDHYEFAIDHLQTVVLPAFKAKGVEINL